MGKNSKPKDPTQLESDEREEALTKKDSLENFFEARSSLLSLSPTRTRPAATPGTMKSSGSSLASRLFRRRRGQGSKRGEEESFDDGKALATSSPSHHHPLATSSPGQAPLVQVEPLHALSSAALHTTSLGAAARALRGEKEQGGVGGRGARENTPAEELAAVATMVSLFGFVFVGPWLTLLALVDVVSSMMAGSGRGRAASGPGSPSSSPSSTFCFSLAFLALVALLTFTPVFPRGAWPLFRNSRVWDCWRRYFRLRIVSPPLPYLEGVDEDESEPEPDGEEEDNDANGAAASSSPLLSSSSSSSSSPLLLPPRKKNRKETKKPRKAYIFAHYPHGCFPVGSFLTAVGLVGCPGTVRFFEFFFSFFFGGEKGRGRTGTSKRDLSQPFSSLSLSFQSF